MKARTPTPTWKAVKNFPQYDLYRNTEFVGAIFIHKHNKAIADALVKACNNHDALVSALECLLMECTAHSPYGGFIGPDSRGCEQARAALAAVKS